MKNLIDIYLECNAGAAAATPASTMGMGNPTPPGPNGEPGSEPLVQKEETAKAKKEKLKKKKKVLEKKFERVAPKKKHELFDIIRKIIDNFGYNADLNFIDTSNITDMNYLFSYKELKGFNGDISNWDTSNVTDMKGMFFDSEFNGDISNWDVSKVKNMNGMFQAASFNGDISDWDVSNVEDMNGMFFGNKNFDKDLSKWNVNDQVQHAFFSVDSKLKNKHCPKF